MKMDLRVNLYYLLIIEIETYTSLIKNIDVKDIDFPTIDQSVQILKKKKDNIHDYNIDISKISVTRSPVEIKGHTSYLTFALYPPQ